MGVSVLFDGKEGDLTGWVNHPNRSLFDDLRLVRGDVCGLRFGLDTCPEQETH
jgi:hypothetical protein